MKGGAKPRSKTNATNKAKTQAKTQAKTNAKTKGESKAPAPDPVPLFRPNVTKFNCGGSLVAKHVVTSTVMGLAGLSPARHQT